nr:ATP-binding protein [uncultured Albidiferax sp.]
MAGAPHQPTPVARRYALTLGLALATITLLVGVLQTGVLYRATERQVAVALALQGDVIQERVNALLGSVEAQMQALASMPWTAVNLTADDRILEFRRLIQLVPAILDMRLVTRTGTQVLFVSSAYPTDTQLRPFAQLPLIDAANTARAAVFGAVEHEPGRVMPFVYLAVPDQGRSGMVSVARVSLKAISESLTQMSSLPGTTAFITGPMGQVLAHSSPTLILQMAGRAASPVQANGVVMVEHDGLLYYSYTRALGKTGWHFHFEQRRDVVLAPVHTAVKITFALVLASLVLALGLGRWLAQRLAGPLVQISNSAKRFALGEFSHRAGPQADTELNEVASSFNQMATELHAYTTDLQRCLEEKSLLLQQEFVAKEGKSREIAKLEERARIMRDLHDGLGSHLIGLLGMAKQSSPDTQAIGGMVQDALIEFRIAIDSLAPREPSLLAALANLRHRLAPRLDATGIAFFWDLNQLDEAVQVGPEKVFHLQRILLEAITNAVRHARKATQISIRASLGSAHELLDLRIADDGETPNLDGVEDMVAASGSRGLANMRARAELIGATVTVTPRETRGVEVCLQLPL